MFDIQKLFERLESTAKRPTVFETNETGRRTPTLIIPDGYKAEYVPLNALPDQLYVHQQIVVRRYSDFVGYVNKYKNNDSFIVLAPTLAFDGSPIAQATLDYHHPGSNTPRPEWGRHTVSYVPQVHPAYALLCTLSQNFYAQGQFAEEVKRLQRFLVSMAKADLLELLRTFTVTTKGEFKSAEDELTGSVDFRFAVQVQGSSGTAEKKLTVPEIFTFNMPMLYDGESRMINAEFRYRAPEKGDDRVRMTLSPVDREFEELAELDALSAKLREDTSGLLTVVGNSKNLYAAAATP